MSWLKEIEFSWFQRLCINVIKSGPLPKHVAFIMDGNRRYAAKNNVLKIEGHTKGFDKLTETLEWCRELGIQEMTVYAFSIENFKRNQEEVDMLMELSREKFKRLVEDKEKLMEAGICVRVIGNLDYLSIEMKKLMAEAIILTKDNNKCVLNIAFAYTARDEITNGIKTVLNGIESDLIKESDINDNLLSHCLYTSSSPEPDLLVRTSGEVRFSDFLLWQISSTSVCFTNVLWPEFSLWHLLGALFKYQRSYDTLKKLKDSIMKNREENSSTDIERQNKFINDLKIARLNTLQCYAV